MKKATDDAVDGVNRYGTIKSRQEGWRGRGRGRDRDGGKWV